MQCSMSSYKSFAGTHCLHPQGVLWATYRCLQISLPTQVMNDAYSSFFVYSDWPNFPIYLPIPSSSSYSLSIWYVSALGHDVWLTFHVNSTSTLNWVNAVMLFCDMVYQIVIIRGTNWMMVFLEIWLFLNRSKKCPTSMGRNTFIANFMEAHP
jgi:hypothetical protein